MPKTEVSLELLLPIISLLEACIKFRDMASSNVFLGGGGGGTGDGSGNGFSHSDLTVAAAKLLRSDRVAPLDDSSFRSFGRGSVSVGDLRRRISL